MTYPYHIKQAQLQRRQQAAMADEAGVYLPTGPGDAQRMELLRMPGDGSDVWLDVRAVQLYLQISLTSIYKLIHGLATAVEAKRGTAACYVVNTKKDYTGAVLATLKAMPIYP